MRLKMEEVWMGLAERLAERSTGCKNRVGCVVVSRDLERVYSVGYNGGAKGQDNVCDCSSGDVPCSYVHAEDNALIKCYTYDPEKVMFVTLFPCERCQRKIVNSGFSRVYFTGTEVHSSVNILGRANINVVQL